MYNRCTLHESPAPNSARPERISVDLDCTNVEFCFVGILMTMLVEFTEARADSGFFYCVSMSHMWHVDKVCIVSV